MVAALHGLPDRPVRDAVLAQGSELVGPRVGIRWYAPGGLVKVAEELRELEFGERMPLAAAP